jgi:transglutaminase-like putative cysteine protease
MVGLGAAGREGKDAMRLRIGYELEFEFPQPTPVLSVLNVHFSRASDLEAPDLIRLDPAVPLTSYRDGFGNWCGRFTAPAGKVRIGTDTVIRDSGLPDPVVTDAGQHPIEELPDEALVFLLASRFCESDRMLDLAWSLFGTTPPGWPRVQAICDFVYNHIHFDYQQARPTRSASEGYAEGVGVCRDYAHLAVAFCRAMNIPARYCTGYLGDVGTPPPYPPGDFAAWFEAYLGGAWRLFDPRNNVPRQSRVLMARGRDAADVALTTTFGPGVMLGFRVWTDEVLT